MEQIFTALNNFKIFHNEKVRIDSRICELHYRFSTMMLFTFSSIISIAELFGSPIKCIQSGSPKEEPVSEKFMNTFCFTQNTFIYINQTRAPLTYPGVVGTGNAKHIKYDSYYQWVFSMLLLQMFVLLAPHYLWKHVEDGLMSRLLKTNEHYMLKSPEVRSNTFKKICGYLVKRHGTFSLYSYSYLFNNIFNTAAVCFNIYTSEILLKGYFKYLGIQFTHYLWRKENSDHLINPLDITFPKMAKCSFPKYGPSGTLMTLDAMCLMPLNNFNEKFFIILWFWYLLLLCLSVCNLIMKIIQWFAIISNITFLMKIFFALHGIHEGDMRNLQKKLDVGQWFFLDIVRLNLNSLYYQEFLKSLAAKLQYKNHNNNRIAMDNGVVANGPNGHVGHGDGFEC